MEDTLRNRLLLFIAKWSPESQAFEAGTSSQEPAPALLLDDRSLVKWETTDPDNAQGREVLRVARDLVRAAHGDQMPSVLDPFAGGGAIPLEVARLGGQAIANDYNPVAWLILRATCELPQRYGKPGRRLRKVEEFGQEVEREVEVPNVLAHDVECWAQRVLDDARQRIGHLYPAGRDGRPVVGYLWARTVPCSNRSCRAEVPLLKSLLVCNKDEKRVALAMEIDREARTTRFGIVKGSDIVRTEGTTLSKGNVRCPFCEEITKVEDVRRAGCDGLIGERMVAIIIDGEQGKDYRPVQDGDLASVREASAVDVERPSEPIRPEVTGSAERVANRGDITVHLYGMKTWGSLYNPRQLLAMQTFTACLRESLDAMHREIQDEDYRRAVAIYVGLWLSRNSMRMSSVGRWDVGEEKYQTPFDGARLPMKSDYPEANPFSDVTGGFANQLDLMLRVIRREAFVPTPARVLLGDGARVPVADGQCDSVVTDPPYFDEAAYADLSDFFHIWLQRALSDVVPEAFLTPQTPKEDEATALRHRHGGSSAAADEHFSRKLAEVFAKARRAYRPDGLVSVVFAHQDARAWTALVRSLFAAGLTIDATWPIEMEMKNRMRGLNSAALETSITVVCRPRVAGPPEEFRDVRDEIRRVVQESVRRFWSYGFRGADLIVACYGPAVGAFGRHERVEKADGTPVEIPELLDLARGAARDAIAGEFRGDELSTLYYVWATLYGAAQQAWDDARLVAQIGGAESAMETARQHGLFVVDGPRCRLALLADRADRRSLGAAPDPPLIDALHRAMALWKDERRADLVRYLAERGLFEDARVWKLAQALFEILPRPGEDWKLVSALLAERETLRAEARQVPLRETQASLFPPAP